MRPIINREIVCLIEDVQFGQGMLDKRRWTKEHELETNNDKLVVTGNPGPGARVEILWTLFDEPDIGYIFTLPGFDSNDIYIAGIVHTPKPQGCEKSDCDPEWIYLCRLLDLDELIEVRIIER